MASAFRKLRVARTAGAVLAFLLPAISLGSDEVQYVPPKSPAVREKLEWFRDQKLCLMMHFGVYSILGITESWPLSTKDAFWARTDIEWTKDDAEFKRQYFALNVGPMPDGRLPRPALERMETMGRWLEKNGEAIYGTRAASVASLGRRVTSYATRDAKEIAKLLVIETSIDFLRCE